jgi:hypothetical protein
MTPRKSPSRLKTTLNPVVELAKVLGELGYRRKLVAKALKTFDLRTRTEREELKTLGTWGKTSKKDDAALTRHAEMLDSLQEQLKHLEREHYLAWQESEQLERLEAEIQSELDEKISSLTKRLE